MNEPTSDKQIAILADDFTGANDAGVSPGAERNDGGCGAERELRQHCASPHL